MITYNNHETDIFFPFVATYLFRNGQQNLNINVFYSRYQNFFCSICLTNDFVY
jgi:hypothetical protein